MDRERDLSFDLIDEDEEIHTVLKVAGLTIVENMAGFVGIHGTTGTAKSDWGRILVSMAIKAGASARYTLGKAVEQSLFPKREDDSRDHAIRGEAMDVLKRVTLLVVDEAQDINWEHPWISAQMGAFFEDRYRAATHPDREQRQVTVLISQEPFGYLPPRLQSRLRDGHFQVPWPEGVPAPKGYVDADGLVQWPIQVIAEDYRPVHPTAMRPISRLALMHPDTHEVLEEIF